MRERREVKQERGRARRVKRIDPEVQRKWELKILRESLEHYDH